jgi:hypothetical protein
VSAELPRGLATHLGDLSRQRISLQNPGEFALLELVVRATSDGLTVASRHPTGDEGSSTEATVADATFLAWDFHSSSRCLRQHHRDEPSSEDA